MFRGVASCRQYGCRLVVACGQSGCGTRTGIDVRGRHPVRATRAFRAESRVKPSTIFFIRHPSVCKLISASASYDRQLRTCPLAAFSRENPKRSPASRAASPQWMLLGCSPDAQLDREYLLARLRRHELGIDVIRQWAKNPDMYSGGVTNAPT